MLDFTSALYLRMRHPSRSLPPWESLTTGRPALLGEAPGAGDVADALAALAGCEAGVLLPSTLHLFWDLFGVLTEERVAIHLDEGAYAVARWGGERAAARGVPVRRFRHHDPDALLDSVRRGGGRNLRPVVVTDGFCTGCGRSAPLAEYLAVVRRGGGLLVLDDTQALGILGRSPGKETPFGTGGGGSLRHLGLGGADILWGASLAKGFGVPVAVLAGSARRVRRFAHQSETRTHCSPPSAAAVRAAASALEINATSGEALRFLLAQRVARFRSRGRGKGISTGGGLFPVQTVQLGARIDPAVLHRRLLRAGVRSVLLRGDGRGVPGFLMTAGHSPAEIDRGVELLAAGIAEISQPPTDSFSPEDRYEYVLRL